MTNINIDIINSDVKFIFKMSRKFGWKSEKAKFWRSELIKDVFGARTLWRIRMLKNNTRHYLYDLPIYYLGCVPALLGLRWVNVYSVTRHYGGPEEGGWYYNAYELVDYDLAPLFLANVAKQEFVDLYKDDAWGNIYSVRGGKEFEVCIEKRKGASETKERPHFE